MPNCDHQNEDLLPLGEKNCKYCKDDWESIPDNYPHDCVESWKDKVKAANNLYNTAAATAAKATAAYDNAAAWAVKLKNWRESARSAHKKAGAIRVELDRLSNVASQMEWGTERTARAIRALLCLAGRVFCEVWALVRVGTTDDPEEGIVYGYLQKLKHYIECEANIDDKKRQAALACIAPYEAKMAAVHAKREALLRALLEMLRIAGQLAASIKSSDDRTGLRWQIEDLRNRIKGKKPDKGKAQVCGCHQRPNQPAPADPPSPCGKQFPGRRDLSARRGERLLQSTGRALRRRSRQDRGPQNEDGRGQSRTRKSGGVPQQPAGCD